MDRKSEGQRLACGLRALLIWLIVFFFLSDVSSSISAQPPLSLSLPLSSSPLLAAHENIERLERSIVADYHGNPRGHRDKLAQAHRVRRALDAIKERARFLLDAHADADGRRGAASEALRGGAAVAAAAAAAGDADERATAAALRAFDERLAEARRYHARFRDDGEITMDDELAAATAAARARALGGGLGGGGAAGVAAGAGGLSSALLSSLDAAAAALAADASALPSFTGEEAGGRCLDLHEHHLAFVNSSSSSSSSGVASSSSKTAFGRQDCDYSEFLSLLSDFDRLVVAPPASGAGGTRRRRSRARSAAPWRQYLRSLLAYLEDFHARTQPLTPLAKVYKAAGVDDFDARWEAGEVEGWRDRGLGSGGDEGVTALPAPSSGAFPPALPAPALDLSSFSSPGDLEALGADALRDALAALGLKAGGSVEQRAARLWLTKDTPLTSLDRKHFARGSEVAAAVAAAAAAARRAAPLALPAPGDDEKEGHGGGENGAERDAGPSRKGGGVEASSRASALLELKVSALLNGPLAAALEETRASVEKKAARTYEEALADAEEREAADGGGGEFGGAGASAAAATAAHAAANDDTAFDSDEDDEHVHNPLKLPLGWDGKPIPYWLFKLHGLDKEFSCEICGGASYRGRREFERHFRETRHATGMRALGIPNTKEFYEVTRIADAQALWETLRARRAGGGGGGGVVGAGKASGGATATAAVSQRRATNAAVAADEVEEVEDEEGNVYDRRTYEDLKKQGIL